MHLYYNRQGEPIDIYDFVKIMEHGMESRTIGRDYVDDVMVSTVFLGIDHSFTPGGPPLIFETMVFFDITGDTAEEFTTRYSTEEEAQAGHASVLAQVRRGIKASRA